MVLPRYPKKWLVIGSARAWAIFEEESKIKTGHQSMHINWTAHWEASQIHFRSRPKTVRSAECGDMRVKLKHWWFLARIRQVARGIIYLYDFRRHVHVDLAICHQGLRNFMRSRSRYRAICLFPTWPPFFSIWPVQLSPSTQLNV